MLRFARFLTSRSYSTSAVQAPKQPIHLGALADNAGAVSQRKRVGRGPGSGLGKTAGRGHKGQKARSGNGKPTPGFEGGQTPLYKRVPKRGFYNLHGKNFQEVNLDRLQHWVQSGRIDASKTITMKDLLDTRCIHKIEDGVKLLGVGAESFSLPITIEVSKASQPAIAAIEKAGGKVTLRDYKAPELRAHVHPEKYM
ncbi:ribosomal protein L18e/L15P [Dichotomocladium elegans]|nr:ribosomal protein L18e/L15P [Dichotomocladium elegans]